MDDHPLGSELRAAIDSHIPTRTDDRFDPDYYSWEAGRMALVFWADALVRDIDRLHTLLDASKACTAAAGDGTLPLEEAFWRIDAACEKIRALLALSLGVPALVVEKNALYFRPAGNAWDRVQHKLRELARSDPEVSKLAKLYDELSEATEYRNQVSHSLSAICHTYLAPYVGVYLNSELDEAKVLHHYLAPKGLFAPGEGIGAPELLARALRTAEAAAASLEQAALMLAGLIQRHGVLDCGPRVYFVQGPDGGTTHLTDPRLE